MVRIEDFLWSIQVAAHAERFLRLPIALYFYRNNPESLTNAQRVAEQQISTCARAVTLGADALNALARKIPLLKSEPFLMFVAMKYFLNTFLYRTAAAREKLSLRQLYEILSREFPKDLTVPFFLTVIDAQQSKMAADAKRLAELEAAVKNLSKE